MSGDANARGLMCAAPGCPNRWSVDDGSKPRCSAHAWATPHAWPVITAEQRAAQASREEQGQLPGTERVFTQAQKAEVIRGLQAMHTGQAGGNKRWAEGLRDREHNHDGFLPNGRRMTRVQREAWREALGPAPAVGEVDDRV